MEEYTRHEDQQTKKRPDLLTVLCILTFIGSGLMGFSNLIVALSHDIILSLTESGELMFPGMEIYLSLPMNYFFLTFLFMAASLFGAIQMWKLKKIGFHVYTIGQVLLLVLPTLYPQFPSYPYMGILFTALFITLYASNLKHMS
jgi:hypothetical protein